MVYSYNGVQLSNKKYKFYQTLKEDLIPILHKLFQKSEEERTFPNLLYEVSITLTPKPDKDIIRKLQTNIPNEHRCRNPQKKITKLNPVTYKKDFAP